MSLYRKLGTAVLILMVVVFVITVSINGANSVRYLSEQLSTENHNDAESTAQDLSDDGIDLQAMEFALERKLVRSSIRRAALLDNDRNIVWEQENPAAEQNFPELLKTLFPISAEPGIAPISNGWSPLGYVVIERYEDGAYDELWAIATRLFWALLLAVLVAGVLGNFLLRRILAPLKAVVAQAQAIGERRFITTEEPSTTEFAEVTRAMNELARRVREMLEKESQRLSRQREAADMESGTGLLLRGPFMARLGAKLESEDADASGSLALVRLGNLARLNQHFGRETMDTVLKEIGSTIKRLNISQPDWIAGRLNGSDFCLIAPRETEPKLTAETLQRVIREVLSNHGMTDQSALPGSCVAYTSGETTGTLMSAIDGALVMSDEQGDSQIVVATLADGSATPIREQASLWRSQLMVAIEDKQLLIATFPVLTPEGKLIHHEGMLRVRVNGQLRSAGEFMPWVHRLDLSREIDQAATALAIENIIQTGENSCANLTASAVSDSRFAAWLEQFLQKHQTAAGQLSIEVGEAAAFAHPAQFQDLVKRAHGLNVTVGIEHMGYRISDIGKLGDMGMDYIKIDSLFSRDLANNPGNAALLRTYVGIAQSLGVPCIAEGINNSAELQAVYELGASGACGRGVEYRGR